MTSSSRNSPWRPARTHLPLRSPPPPLPVLPLRPPARALVGTPSRLTTVAASAAVAAKATAAVALLDRGHAPLVAPNSSSSSRPAGGHGPASTTPGPEPFRCGQGDLVHRWHPSQCLLTCRRSSRHNNTRSSRPSSPNSSSTPLLSTSRPLPSLLLMALDSGSPPGITTRWLASPLGTRRPSPPPSAQRRCPLLRPTSGTSTQVLLHI